MANDQHDSSTDMKQAEQMRESVSSDSELRKRYTKVKREPGHRIFVNRSLQLDRIKFYGFDMDYTLALYKSPEFEELTFQQVLESLIELGYPEQICEFVYDRTFPLRGLWYDKLYGNLLKVDAYGNILTVVHGFKFLSGHEVRQTYPNKYVTVDDRIYVFYTLFNLPEIYLIACLIDYFSTVATYTEDRTAVIYGKNILSFRAIFNDVRNSIDRVHHTGKLKEIVCENIEQYIHRDEQLPVLLDRIRSHNAKTFLLTNSEYWYTDKLMTYLLTDKMDDSKVVKRDWKSYFNFIIVDAQKPLFFAEGTTLRNIDPKTGSMKLGSYSGKLQENEVYSGGSCEMVSKLIGSMGKDVLYVGDHIFGDIIKSKKQKAWRTMLVVPELNHELKVFHERRELFNTLESLDTTISELLRSFDMTSDRRPDAVTKIKQKIQECTHELDMNFGLLGSLFRTGSRQTHFASQVTRFADIYASTVVNLVYYPFFYFFRAVPQLMPHESTVDPEEPLHFKSWGDEKSQMDSLDRRRSTFGQISTMTPQFSHSLSIQTHPDLPLRVTHDHDDDGDPDDDISLIESNGVLDYRSRITYTPPKRKMEETLNGDEDEHSHD
ncbi:unnamed protein product [Rotaria socialis]|uniref:Cytosolic purine 5'-nucleotidase n=1 Tax=Rotaria socialis TaxID=392032 RepID=A0A818AB24_9BILA|nr:unnamed protein product [Rotaria socialis]CAF3402845.1 unnamed protein product [Rotaria socialis]CAF3490111.1 unnamed protein product [Rotaria socialis]CAF3539254.1 unnamed protein product [Rotaria socialis]CAF3678726.1 unnamed protein product [Rotaria socialis]